MKRLFIHSGILLSLSVLPATSHAQHQDWENKLIHSGTCKVHAVTTDAAGNTLITGSFKGSITFHETRFVSHGASDIFTAKYTAHGNLLWGQQAGSANDDEAYAITSDKNGNIYITGYFSGFFNMGNLALDATETEKNCFVLKYDKDGFIQWAVRSFGIADKSGKAITTDQEGNILFAGVFSKEMLFEYEDPNEKCETRTDEEREGKILKSKSPSNVFIAKMSSKGELIWFQQSNGKGSNDATAIESDSNSNCYVKGTFSNRCVFGNTKIKSKKGNSLFVTKYDPTGNVVWARPSGDSSSGIKGSSGITE